MNFFWVSRKCCFMILQFLNDCFPQCSQTFALSANFLMRQSYTPIKRQSENLVFKNLFKNNSGKNEEKKTLSKHITQLLPIFGKIKVLYAIWNYFLRNEKKKYCSPHCTHGICATLDNCNTASVLFSDTYMLFFRYTAKIICITKFIKTTVNKH